MPTRTPYSLIQFFLYPAFSISSARSCSICRPVAAAASSPKIIRRHNISHNSFFFTVDIQVVSKSTTMREAAGRLCAETRDLFAVDCFVTLRNKLFCRRLGSHYAAELHVDNCQNIRGNRLDALDRHSKTMGIEATYNTPLY